MLSYQLKVQKEALEKVVEDGGDGAAIADARERLAHLQSQLEAMGKQLGWRHEKKGKQ